MKSVILLNANENVRRIEEEEKFAFVRTILEKIGVPLEGIWNEDGNFAPQGHNKLRTTLGTYNMLILDNKDGEVKIYVDKDVVATWRKPSYILKRDLSQIDPKKKLFLQMTIDHDSVFDATDE